MKITKILISLIFLFAGSTKLLGLAFQVQSFAHWGYPWWFMYVVGTVEICSVILLWTKFSEYAKIVLLCLMAGAFYTHISSGDPIPVMGLAIVSTILLLINIFLSRKKEAKMSTL